MPQRLEIETIIEKAVSEVLEEALPELRARITGRVTEGLRALLSSGSSSELLEQATAAVQEASSQADILRQLLDSGSRFAGRLALFVVRSGAITGWQAIGFSDNDSIKSASLDEASAVVSESFKSRAPVEGRASEFDSAFLTRAGSPAKDHCVLLPLIVKEKVAAVVYADAGTDRAGFLDASALKVLTRSTALWLEVVSLRKATPGEDPQMASAATAAPSAAPSIAAAPPTVPRPAATIAATGASEESELHRKALRFAKLLVEEIKLYNQTKVTEGRQQGDLYERLREDIEKSRATYEKRYGESPVASANYFDQELIRILADNNVALMGAGFPR